MNARYTHLRPRPEARASVVRVPLDVRLMHMAASFMFMGFVLAALLAGVWALIRLPAFAVTDIKVHGDVEHNNAVTLRANVASKLTGNFFTVDLRDVRRAFENVPWVRVATVQREFPNRLHVTLQEHQPVAHWGSEVSNRVVNNFGEVFEVNAGDFDDHHLPRLNGPDNQSQQVLAMYATLAPRFKALDLRLASLELTQRGSWRAKLTQGAMVELGRGSMTDVQPRMARMSSTVVQVSHQLGRNVSALESADLRYGNGYALRLRGVSTQDVQAKH